MFNYSHLKKYVLSKVAEDYPLDIPVYSEFGSDGRDATASTHAISRI